MELLRFRCTACGNCCRGLRVAVTDADVANPSFDPGLSGKLKRLELLPLNDCRYELDGHTSEAQLTHEDERRWQELHRYQAHVARWNRLAKHQRRLGQRVGSAEAFFDFLRRVRDS